MKKILLLSMFLLLGVLGVTAGIKGNENSSPETVALDFMNEYIKFNEWYNSAPVTDNFRREFKNIYKVIYLEEDLLNNRIKEKDLSAEDRKLLKKYHGAEYDAVIGYTGDILNESKFRVVSYNKKTGIVLLKDTWEESWINDDGQKTTQGGTEIKVKMIKMNGKWFVDGAGRVNMPGEFN